MSHDSQINTALEALVAPVCKAHGVELVDVRHLGGRGGGIVRIIIDRESPEGLGSGVTVDDCQAVSRDVSAALDVHDDLIAGSFELEVSSPGLERPLIKLQDFQRFAGREVRVRTFARLDGRRRFQGMLLGVVDEQVQLEQDGETVNIPYEAVSKANLVYRF